MLIHSRKTMHFCSLNTSTRAWKMRRRFPCIIGYDALLMDMVPSKGKQLAKLQEVTACEDRPRTNWAMKFRQKARMNV
jgi:hypothetical protein